MSKSISDTIYELRFPLTVLIILPHIPFLYKSDNSLLISIVNELFQQGICRIAVPTFFFISGYLFFRHLQRWDTSTYISKIKKRCKTLALPYMIWNTIPIILLILTHSKLFVYDYMEDHGWWRVFWDCNRYGYVPKYNFLSIEMYNSKPINFPFWYIRDLCVVMILSPIIWSFITGARMFGIVLLGIAMILNLWIPFEGFSINAFFYFTLGAFMRIYEIDFLALCKRWEFHSYIFSFIILLLKLYLSLNGHNAIVYNICHQIFALTGMVVVINITQRIKWKINDTLVQSSFFMYAMHALIASRLVKLTGKIIMPTSDVTSITLHLITTISTILLCVMTYLVLKKAFPKFLFFINGGR